MATCLQFLTASLVVMLMLATSPSAAERDAEKDRLLLGGSTTTKLTEPHSKSGSLINCHVWQGDKKARMTQPLQIL